MTQWYAKQLSKLTNVSVRTLHHYDRVDLLKPTVRLENGYRLYSESDLLKLQQIIALKFFGFELSQIKVLLANEMNVIEQFTVQSQLLRQKVSLLNTASEALDTIINDCDGSKTIPWETIIKLIEVFRMTQQLEQTWVGKVLNSDELKEYAAFQQELLKQSKEAKESFQKKWATLVAKISVNLHTDPASDFGMQLGKESMDLVNGVYGKERAGLRRKIWEEGFKKGYAGEEHGISPEIVDWLDKAIGAYYRKQGETILAQIGKVDQTKLKAQWDAFLEDMLGFDQKAKDDFHLYALQEHSVGEKAKNWIKMTYKL
ncbi:MAG: MerR family transcriptional regulator [Gammaproteobacteria bacterium]|nr:MerR family transcriptional regulator [Gammaproteobacteria bacterium]